MYLLPPERPAGLILTPNIQTILLLFWLKERLADRSVSLLENIYFDQLSIAEETEILQLTDGFLVFSLAHSPPPLPSHVMQLLYLPPLLPHNQTSWSRTSRTVYRIYKFG